MMPTDLDGLLTRIAACRACAGDFGHEPRPGVMVSPRDRLRDWLVIDAATFYGDDRIGGAAQACCFPGTSPAGGDYPPPKRCAELWRVPLLEALDKVELTLLVGSHAQSWALAGRYRGMTETVRNWRDHLPDALPLPHPSWRNTAWLARHPWFETEVLPYLRDRVRGILHP